MLLFFSPDISILGYLLGSRAGAILYNLFHHRAIAVALAATGLCLKMDTLTAIGLHLFAHSFFNRMMGYGLKFLDDFKHTCLGWKLLSLLSKGRRKDNVWTLEISPFEDIP